MATLKRKEPLKEDYSRGVRLEYIHGFHKPTKWTAETTSYKAFSWPDMPMPEAKVGIEIEVEGIYKDCTFENYWTSKEDGSLRNHGMEYVSVPIHGKHIPYALTGLMTSLKVTNPKYHFSPRTSVHVHLDMTEYGTHDLTNLLMIYTVVESLLFKFAGKDRDRSVFCVPYSTTHFGDRIFVTMAERGWYSGVSKYMAVNISRLRDLGTIEFRQLPGTDDVEKIVTWICLIQQLLKRAREVDHSTLIRRIQDLNTNSEYFMFLSWVFEDYIKYLDLSSHRTDMDHGVKCVKLFSYTYLNSLHMFEEGSPLYKAVEKDLVKKKSYSEQLYDEQAGTITGSILQGWATTHTFAPALAAGNFLTEEYNHILMPNQDVVDSEDEEESF